MSVLIKGMEMPKDGTYSIVHIYSDGHVSMPCWGKGMQIVSGITAVPVPPHGRLGDLDELHKEAVRRSEKARTYDSWYNCTDRVISAFDIEDAPTIIEAE